MLVNSVVFDVVVFLLLLFSVMPTDCTDVKRNFPSATSGQHEIKLWKSRKTLTVVCDMDTEGGGWTVKMC
jgi:hypothetical protein